MTVDSKRLISLLDSMRAFGEKDAVVKYPSATRALEKLCRFMLKVRSWSSRRIQLGKGDPGVIDLHIESERVLKSIDRILRNHLDERKSPIQIKREFEK